MLVLTVKLGAARQQDQGKLELYIHSRMTYLKAESTL